MSEDSPRTALEMQLMREFPPSPAQRVTLANWCEGAPVRWSFMRAGELIPHAEAHRGPGPAYALHRREQDIDGIGYKGHLGRELSIAEMLTRTYTDGFLVLQHGRIVSETYFNGMRPHHRHLLQSVSKSLTSALAGILIQRGELDVDARIDHYLPEMTSSAYADASVQHLLDMTVAVDYGEDYGNPDAQVFWHEIAMGWRPREEKHRQVPESQYEFFQGLQARPGMTHGETFHYVSANTDILGWILERVSATRFTELFERELWQYLGAGENAAMLVDPWGSAVACGGFNVTLQDLGLFGLMMLNHGEHNGRQIVPRAYVEKIRRGGDNAAWHRGDGDGMAELLPKGSYHNQFWFTGNDRGAFFGVGIHGQYVYMDPCADVVIVKFSSQPTAIPETMNEDTLLGFAAIATALG